MNEPRDDAERTPETLVTPGEGQAKPRSSRAPSAAMLDAMAELRRPDGGSPPAPEPVVWRPEKPGEALVSDTEAAEVYVPPTPVRKHEIPRMPTRSVRIRRDLDQRRQPTLPSLRHTPGAARRADAGEDDAREDDASAQVDEGDAAGEWRRWSVVPAMLAAMAAGAMVFAVIRFATAPDRSTPPTAATTSSAASETLGPPAAPAARLPLAPAAESGQSAVAAPTPEPTPGAGSASSVAPLAPPEPAASVAAAPSLPSAPTPAAAADAPAAPPRAVTRARAPRPSATTPATPSPASPAPRTPSTATTGARQIAPFGVEKDG